MIKAANMVVVLILSAMLVACSAPTVTDVQDTREPSIGTEVPALPDFRNMRFGSEYYTVFNGEEARPVHIREDHSTLYYPSVTVMGMEASLTYVFENESCVAASYLFSTKHKNGYGYYNDYIMVKDKLTEKYGMPIQNYGLIKDKIVDTEPTLTEMDFIYDGVSLFTNYDTERYTVNLSLLSDPLRYEFGVYIGYFAKEDALPTPTPRPTPTPMPDEIANSY